MSKVHAHQSYCGIHRAVPNLIEDKVNGTTIQDGGMNAEYEEQLHLVFVI